LADNQIRDLFHTVKTEDITAQQIKNGFGNIFLSQDTIENQLESQEIVAQARSTKAPFYGTALPGSFQMVTTGGEAGYFNICGTTEVNKTYKLIAASVLNAGAGNMVAELFIGDGSSGFAFISETGTIPAGGAGKFSRLEMEFDNSVKFYVQITTGAAGDAVVQSATCELIQ